MRDRDAVVVGYERGLGDALVLPHAFDQVSLLMQRVAVIARLLGGAEAEEVRREHPVAGGERGEHLRPVVRGAREAMQHRDGGSLAAAGEEHLARRAGELQREALAAVPPLAQIPHG